MIPPAGTSWKSVKTTKTVLLAILLAAGEEITDLMKLYMRYVVKYCYSKALLSFFLGSEVLIFSCLAILRKAGQY